ncbi:MAG TPA: hypothetical protein VLA33_07540 [Gemmatimonadota bacterium]|nr:hypothetical protein [Gemmatimonadota bacterium]
MDDVPHFASTPWDAMPSPTTMKWVVAVLGSLGVAALAAQLVAVRLVDGDYVRERLATEFGGEAVDVAIGEATFSLFARRVEVSDLVVSRADRGTFVADRVVATGLPLFGYGRGRAIEVGRLDVERPLFYFHPRRDSVSARHDVEGREAGDALRLRDLRIEHGTALAWRPGEAEGPLLVLVRDFEVEGRDVTFDRAGRLTGSRSGISWRTGPFRRVRTDGLTQVVSDSMQAVVADSTFRLFGFRFEPTAPDAEFFDRLDVREDRIRARLPRVEARGFDFDLWPREGMAARAIQIDSFGIDVLTNRRVPDGPANPWLPHEIVRSFDGRLDVDSLLARGGIEYRDLPAREGTAAGTIRFDDVVGRISGISNADGAPPMVLDATFRLFGAPAEIRVELPLDDDRFAMRTQGRVGSIDLTRLNSLTIPLEGLEIQGGRLEALRYDVTVEGLIAGGTVWVAYRGLDVQMVDRRTGEGGLIADVKSFVANTFVLRSDNMPAADDEDGVKPGPVEHVARADASFFMRLWAPIRSGLMSVTKQ